jgi:hypothetical protein
LFTSFIVPLDLTIGAPAIYYFKSAIKSPFSSFIARSSSSSYKFSSFASYLKDERWFEESALGRIKLLEADFANVFGSEEDRISYESLSE